MAYVRRTYVKGKTYPTGKLYQLEEEKKALSARACAGLHVLRDVFSDIELKLDPSRFVDLDIEMITAVVEDLKSLQEKYRETINRINKIKEDL
jgi:hypothetical protein